MQDSTIARLGLPRVGPAGIGIIFSILCAPLVIGCDLLAQTSDPCPMPTVGVYSCDAWGAAVDTTDAVTLSRYCSRYIYQAIYADTSVNYVFLFSESGVDSLVYSNAGDSVSYFPFTAPPDSVGGTDIDYPVLSDVSGSPGNFTLTISLEDGHTRHHIADGTAHFTSATDSASLRIACTAALAPVLPIIVTINEYESQLKAANPALCIDPHIKVTPGTKKVALKAGVNVTVVATDCDGSPLLNRSLKMKAKGGTFLDSVVTTDQNGQATDLFTAGSKDQFGVLSATLKNVPTVRYDTITADGFSAITIGNPVDTVGKYELIYSMRITEVSFLDQFTYQKNSREDWNQNTSARVFSADGLAIVPVTFLDDGTILFNSTDGDSASFSTGKMLEHDFNFGNGWAKPSDACTDDFTSTEGTSHHGAVDTNGAVVILQYGPASRDVECSAHYNYQGPYYLQTIAFDNCENLTPARLDLYDIGSIVGEVSDTQAVLSGTPTSGYTISAIISMNKSKSKFDPSTGSSSEWDSITTETFVGSLRPVSKLSAVRSGHEESLPASFSLLQNYPNPFNPSTEISYQISAVSNVSLKVYDVLGREVATLVNGREGPARYTISFNASRLPSGVYFYRLVAAPVEPSMVTFTEVRKLIVLK